jgi:serine/threonine-protein kinase
MVLDWGVARAHAGADQSGVVVGTHGFMSPEQARGELATIDERTDVYGLGGVLLALLSGDAAPLGRATVAVDAVGFERIPKPLQSICARALSVNAADRYASAAALGADVSRYRAGQAVLAHRETLVEQTLRVAKAYRTPILLVVAYMVMRTIVALLTGR